MLGAAVEWLAERGVSLMNALGYSDNNAIASKERTARARSKSPSIVSLSSGSMEDDWNRLRKNDLKINDTEFYEIAQEILLKSNAVTQSGLLPSSSQFQESMNRYIASLLKDKNIEPNEFMEALQYRAGKVPMFLDPNNETKLMSATSNLASLLKVKPIPDMGYMDNIIERQTTKLTMSTDSESQSGFLYPPPAARAAHPEANNMVPPPSEPLIPPLEHPPINKQRNTYFHRQPIESFIQQHPLPEQLEQGYWQQQQQQQQRYYSSSAIPQESRFGEPNQNYKAFTYVPSSLPQLWPHQSYANNVPPHRALQLQEQQIWNNEPDDIFFSRSMMEDVAANTPYQLGMVPPDEGGEYGTVPPQQRLQMLLSQERQKVMLEIYNVTELLSRSTNDPLRHRMYKKQLLTLQSELESLFDDFTPANVSDTVKSDQAENRSIASAATISKANYTGNESIASAASISKGAKLIVQEKQNSVSIVKKNSREEKSPSSSSFVEKVSTEKPVVLTPTAEQILATTYHETADEGVKQILLSQDMSKPIATAGLKGEQRGLTISTQKDEPLTNKSIGVIKVRAPMTMPEGYTFEAKVGENVIMIKVPEGGVKKGQIFDYKIVEEKQMYIPLGRWRYPLFSCCVHGANHPMFCSGLFCPQGKNSLNSILFKKRSYAQVCFLQFSLDFLYMLVICLF
jgi:hypothetical protein